MEKEGQEYRQVGQNLPPRLMLMILRLPHQPRTVELEHFLGADDVFETGDYGQAKYHTMDPKDPYRIARRHDFIDEIEPTPSMPIVC